LVSLLAIRHAPMELMTGTTGQPRYGLAAILALAFSGVFALGFAVGGARPPATNVPAGQGVVTHTEAVPSWLADDVDFRQFWEVWHDIKERHVHQPVSDVQMFYGAIAGMVASLGDPYSVYFDPEQADAFSNELAGRFEGIGAEIGIKEDVLQVVAPLKDSPAERAGLRAGDRIIAIDGVDTAGMTVDLAVSKIRGEKGTTVKLLVLPQGAKAAKEISIVRDTIRIDAAKGELVKKNGKTYAHITLVHFNDRTVPQFEELVRSLSLDKVDGIVLDVRNNPGGYLNAAVDVAGAWLGNQTVVQEKFSDGHTETYAASGTALLRDVPTVVLTNGGSASASEILAGALQDQGVATLVGEKTYGKGSVQDLIDFDDQSSLKLTIALWLTPKGRAIDKEGIVPDIEVGRTAEDAQADRDPQLDKAIETLAAPR
jgi:carboxyl-terminal processing protease